MLAKVQKWGNSLAIRIPKALAESANLQCDSPVEITARADAIVVRPAKAKYRLDDLLSQVSEDNRHREIAATGPVGEEIW